MNNLYKKYIVNESEDEKNPEFIFSLTHNELLVKAAKKQIDLQYLAKKTLADRGIGKNGKWVGFDQSKKEWNIK